MIPTIRFDAFQKKFSTADRDGTFPELRLVLFAVAGKLRRMDQGASSSAPDRHSVAASLRAAVPTRTEAGLAVGAALLAILAFPNFDFWYLAWFALVPLLVAVVSARNAARAAVSGWLFGTVFFYGTCWWLTYPMIHYAQMSPWLAYPLFVLPIMLVGFFPALFCGVLARVIQRFGPAALCLAALIWVTFEWLRYLLTGQLWNALGYSQAFHPAMIQSARWGGVYVVTFLIVLANSAITLLLLRSTYPVSIACLLIVAVVILLSPGVFRQHDELGRERLDPANMVSIVAIQPNVPMDTNGDPQLMKDLLARHLSMSSEALERFKSSTSPRLVIWPESPMNFSYARDAALRETIGNFARANHTALLLNSLEPAPDGADQNSAILINEQGVITARYDKIRLMPFGEYVPLPRWLPGASSVRGLVGEFKPGSSHTLMPLGAFRAGVFICIEAAHPGIARAFTQEGAEVLINISNDGYLGPTPVMRQHLANTIFRAVENDRQLLRVTNSGITAKISAAGVAEDQTAGFRPEVRTWTISKTAGASTFYSRHGDVFVYGCALISLGIISVSFMRRRVSEAKPLVR